MNCVTWYLQPQITSRQLDVPFPGAGVDPTNLYYQLSTLWSFEACHVIIVWKIEPFPMVQCKWESCWVLWHSVKIWNIWAGANYQDITCKVTFGHRWTAIHVCFILCNYLIFQINDLKCSLKNRIYGSNIIIHKIIFWTPNRFKNTSSTNQEMV